MRKTCDYCMWTKGKDAPLPHCIDVRNRGDNACSRFQPLRDVDPHHCGFCDRDKDPGKCWWCEQIDA